MLIMVAHQAVLKHHVILKKKVFYKYQTLYLAYCLKNDFSYSLLSFRAKCMTVNVAPPILVEASLCIDLDFLYSIR